MDGSKELDFTHISSLPIIRLSTILQFRSDGPMQMVSFVIHLWADFQDQAINSTFNVNTVTVHQIVSLFTVVLVYIRENINKPIKSGHTEIIC